MPETAAWALLAAALLVGELLTLTLVAGMLGVGALAGLVAAALGAGLPLQVGVAAASSVLLLGVARPVARRGRDAVPALANDPGHALVGQTARVVQQVSDETGQVQVHGELWRARPAVPGDVLPVGTSVWIDAVRGATVTVYPKELP